MSGNHNRRLLQTPSRTIRATSVAAVTTSLPVLDGDNITVASQVTVPMTSPGTNITTDEPPPLEEIVEVTLHPWGEQELSQMQPRISQPSLYPAPAGPPTPLFSSGDSAKSSTSPEYFRPARLGPPWPPLRYVPPTSTAGPVTQSAAQPRQGQPTSPATPTWAPLQRARTLHPTAGAHRTPTGTNHPSCFSLPDSRPRHPLPSPAPPPALSLSTPPLPLLPKLNLSTFWLRYGHLFSPLVTKTRDHLRERAAAGLRLLEAQRRSSDGRPAFGYNPKLTRCPGMDTKLVDTAAATNCLVAEAWIATREEEFREATNKADSAMSSLQDSVDSILESAFGDRTDLIEVTYLYDKILAEVTDEEVIQPRNVTHTARGQRRTDHQESAPAPTTPAAAPAPARGSRKPSKATQSAPAHDQPAAQAPRRPAAHALRNPRSKAPTKATQPAPARDQPVAQAPRRPAAQALRNPRSKALTKATVAEQPQPRQTAGASRCE